MKKLTFILLLMAVGFVSCATDEPVNPAADQTRSAGVEFYEVTQGAFLPGQLVVMGYNLPEGATDVNMIVDRADFLVHIHVPVMQGPAANEFSFAYPKEGGLYRAVLSWTLNGSREEQVYVLYPKASETFYEVTEGPYVAGDRVVMGYNVPANATNVNMIVDRADFLVHIDVPVQHLASYRQFAFNFPGGNFRAVLSYWVDGKLTEEIYLLNK